MRSKNGKAKRRERDHDESQQVSETVLFTALSLHEMGRKGLRGQSARMVQRGFERRQSGACGADDAGAEDRLLLASLQGGLQGDRGRLPGGF